MVRTLLSTWLESYFPGERDQINEFLIHGNSPSLARRILLRLISATFCDPAVGEGVFLTALVSLLRDIFPLEYQSLLNSWIGGNVNGWDVEGDAIARMQNRFSPPLPLKTGDFLLSSGTEKFDLMIANPPYVRQEKLERDYKQKLQARFRKMAPEWKVSQRTDYYLYFMLAMCLRLKQNGVFTAIIPNGWLDNAFGQVFRELLTTEFSLQRIETLLGRRHFKAEVNTVIITVQRNRPGPADSIRIITETKRRDFPQSALIRVKLGWNGSLFRAPDWLLQTISDRKNIVPLETVAEVRAGIITGNNRRYYSNESQRSTDIPVIKSPREIKTYTVGAGDCRWWLPVEKVPYTIRRAPILWPDLRGRRHFVVHNPENLAFEHTFYGLTPMIGSAESLVLILNSIWVRLLVEIYGRTGLGGGAIRMVKRDLVQLPIPDPRSLDWSQEHYRTLQDEIGVENQARCRERDVFILRELGLENRREEMQYLLNYFIEQRQARAQNQNHG